MNRSLIKKAFVFCQILLLVQSAQAADCYIAAYVESDYGRSPATHVLKDIASAFGNYSGDVHEVDARAEMKQLHVLDADGRLLASYSAGADAYHIAEGFSLKDGRGYGEIYETQFIGQPIIFPFNPEARQILLVENEEVTDLGSIAVDLLNCNDLPQQRCIDRGEVLSAGDICCGGLSKISTDEDASVCADCGNGICDASYENFSNCPVDCRPEPEGVVACAPGVNVLSFCSFPVFLPLQERMENVASSQFVFRNRGGALVTSSSGQSALTLGSVDAIAMVRGQPGFVPATISLRVYAEGKRFNQSILSIGDRGGWINLSLTVASELSIRYGLEQQIRRVENNRAGRTIRKVQSSFLAGTIAPGDWSRITVTYEPDPVLETGVIKVYKDDQPIASHTTQFLIPFSAERFAMHLGSVMRYVIRTGRGSDRDELDYLLPVPAKPLVGLMDSISVWTRPLGEEEVRVLHNGK